MNAPPFLIYERSATATPPSVTASAMSSRNSQRLVQHRSRRQHADHGHQQGADRGGRRRQAFERREPADVTQAELDQRHVDHRRPAGHRQRRDLRLFDRSARRSRSARSRCRSATPPATAAASLAENALSARCRARRTPRPQARTTAPAASRRWHPGHCRRSARRCRRAPPAATTARTTDSRSPRIGQARNATQTGIEIPITAASLALSHNSASPMKATQLPIVSHDTSTSRNRMPAGTSRRCRLASAIAASAAAPTMPQSPREESGGHSVSRCFMIGKLRPQPIEVTPRNDKTKRRYPGTARLGNDGHGADCNSRDESTRWHASRTRRSRSGWNTATRKSCPRKQSMHPSGQTHVPDSPPALFD